jgi:ribosomal protein L11 methyltransferase
MLDLFPEGFEEIDGGDGVELVAYTDPGGEERMWVAFGAAAAADVPAGWEDGWRQFHKPVLVDDLWIGPPWETPPPEGPNVIIDPGRAFGTGAHPTTRLALVLLRRLPRGSLLDIGCGSGVIAIAGAKLGFAPVTAVDLDEPAVEATRRNADANGVALVARVADGLRDALPGADVAVANVTREVVEALARRLEAEHLVVSGYLVARQPLSLCGYRHVERVAEDGWAADAYARSAQ